METDDDLEAHASSLPRARGESGNGNTDPNDNGEEIREDIEADAMPDSPSQPRVCDSVEADATSAATMAEEEQEYPKNDLITVTSGAPGNISPLGRRAYNPQPPIGA